MNAITQDPSPSGTQFELREGDRRAVITEVGATLRLLQVGGVDLLDGFAADAMASGGRGQVLCPWPNRIDGGRYTFLATYLPWASGDGMEHRNSTSLTSSGSLATSMDGLLGTVSHEFFHAWNVERIRPRTLEPFSFEEANMSGEVWLAEGFTSYYGPLVIRRAGLQSDADFASDMAGAVNLVMNAPGRRAPRGGSHADAPTRRRQDRKSVV